MNSNPLPKPTPTNNQGKQDASQKNTGAQGVVFDQSKQNQNNSQGSQTQNKDKKDQSQDKKQSTDSQDKQKETAKSRIPLAQKPATQTVAADLPKPGAAKGGSVSAGAPAPTAQAATPVTPPPTTTSNPAPSPSQTLTATPAPNQSSAPNPSAAPKTPNLPPTSLSALSSMSSNKIPTAQGASSSGVSPANTGSTGQSPAPKVEMPQTTVLGRPIPQAIRGEATPVGLAGKGPGMLPPKPTATAVPQPAPGAIKPENPSVGTDSKTQDSQAKPKIAQAKSPIMRFLPFIAGGVVVLLLVIFGLSRLFGGGSSTSVSDRTQTPTTPAQQGGAGGQRTEVPAQQTTIEYWGLWEPSEVMESVIADFEADNPGITVNYVQQSPVDYRERLQTAIQSGQGPDLFRYHASWVPMLRSGLDPIPASVAAAGEFQSNYYPVVTEQLVSGGQYVGVPLMYDGLVLYYNEDILETAGETAPSTWPELRSLAVKLTVPSANGIQRGGLAIGNATNVEHFSDILAALILQNGGTLADADSVETRDALLFYTNFQLRDNVWDETLPSSTVAFARGDVAMMFAPSWRAHEVRALNPDLNFATTTLPQLSEEDPITWANYWAEGISAESENKEAAAAFLSYLIQDETLRQFYSSASEVRAFGEIYPKISLAEEIEEDPIIGPVLEDAVFAQSWYLNSRTHDNGINDQMIGYYKAAIDAILEGEDVEDVQPTLSEGVDQVLTQYGVSSR